MLLASIRAMPKSAIFARSSRVIMMLAGLMSRCTTPLAWLNVSPARMSSISLSVASVVSRSLAANTSFSERPSTNSMTM